MFPGPPPPPPPPDRTDPVLRRLNVTVGHSPFRVDANSVPSVPNGQDLKPAPIDPSIDKWFFISGAAV